MTGIAGRVTGAVVLALALGVGGAERAVAQEPAFLTVGAGFLGVGVAGIGTGGLDDRLEARGYPTFGSTATTVSIGAYGILAGGLTVGGEWNGLIIGDGLHEGRQVGIGGGYGTLGLGYMFELSPRVRVYPRLGIGAGGLGFWMENDSVVGFDEVLADPQPETPVRQPVLSRDSAVLDLGLGAELLPGGWARGLMVGVRLGYLASPSDSEWQLYDHTVRGGPTTSIAGPYLRALIGVGKRR